MDSKLTDLGILIKENRIRMRMTVLQMACECMCSLNRIYQIERGEIPSLQMLKVIFDVLELNEHFDEYKQAIEDAKFE
jgi:transcriptional regulator with XRE-family HTH domain